MCLGRAEGVREDQAAGALRRSGPRAVGGDRGLGKVLYRNIAAFRKEGMESLFSSPKAKRRVLP